LFYLATSIKPQIPRTGKYHVECGGLPPLWRWCVQFEMKNAWLSHHFSTSLRERPPMLVLEQERAHLQKQFTHDGCDGLLVQFATRAQASIHMGQRVLATDRAEGRHVEHLTRAARTAFAQAGLAPHTRARLRHARNQPAVTGQLASAGK